MAIYWIDPHNQTNGSGTFASPWTTGSQSKGLANGDEVRIKGVALTSLLTATVYTATLTNQTTMTITAGGGLGADFVMHDIVYIPQYDTFWRVYSSASNQIAISSPSGALPVLNTAHVGTSMTIRKVNTATYGPGAYFTAYYNLVGTAARNNITISDCWIDETTRVTDGSVKTLLNSTSSGRIDLQVDVAGSVGTIANLQNTVVMGGMSSVAASGLPVLGHNGTISVGQMVNHDSVGSGGISFGSATAPAKGNTVNVTTISSVAVSGGLGSDNTVNITNFANYAVEQLMGRLYGHFVYNLTVNVAKIIAWRCVYGGMLSGYHTKTTVNLNGMCEVSQGVGSIFEGYGDITINCNAGFVLRTTNNTVTSTSWGNLVFLSGTNLFTGNRMVFPTINLPANHTFTSYCSIGTLVTQTTPLRQYKQPHVFNLEFQQDSRAANTPNGYTLGTNVLVTFRNGAAPFEILSIQGGYSAAGTNNQFPILTKDASVFRTAGPSLKANLATRTAAWWTSGTVNVGEAIKNIKIPCVSGTSYTVTGYIRNNITGFANGDVRMSIVLRDTEIVGQNMTTASNGAWEQFTLTFTASETAEYVLCWEMYYAAAGSIWLDDLAVA